jgi:putative transposase
VARITSECWHRIPIHFPNVTLDLFVIMPNHIHGILLLSDVGAGHARPVPVIVGSFKSAVSRQLGHPVWQRSYWERIIRNERELNEIRHYIDENPARWELDVENAYHHGTLPRFTHS